MNGVIETAIELHRELRRRGLELNPKHGRDVALQADIATRLGISSNIFTSDLKAAKVSAEFYLRELMTVAQPFAQMFEEIWRYLGRQCAPKAKESLRIRFGFDNDKAEIDWDQFRVMVQSTRRVWKSGPVLLWPSEDLFLLARILTEGIRERRYPRYRPGEALHLHAVAVVMPADDLGQRIREVLQSLIDEIHALWPKKEGARRELPELRRTDLEEADEEEQGRMRSLAYLLTDLIPSWGDIFEQWSSLPRRVKVEANNYFNSHVLPKLSAGISSGWRTVLEALDILDLPFWRHRWHTYEVWAVVKALEGLEDFRPRPTVKAGRIPLDASEPALVACLSAREPIFAHVQGETLLPKPIGKRRKIKPDLRFSIDDPATNGGTIAIVEFKQRRCLDPEHASEVLTAYSAGVGLGGGVIMINYDAVPSTSIPPRCLLLGHVHPGQPTQVWNYQQSVRDCFKRASLEPVCQNVIVLLDISSSMGTQYNTSEAQRGLRQLLAIAGLRIFRFNNGLVSGGDWKGSQGLVVMGGTELGMALRQLFEDPSVGVPDRMLVVTDGGHDHPHDLLKRIPDYRECEPTDLGETIDWLRG